MTVTKYKSSILTAHPLSFVSRLGKAGHSEKVRFRRLLLFFLMKRRGWNP